MPRDIELFLENQISSLPGTSLLKLNHCSCCIRRHVKNNENENSKNHEDNEQIIHVESDEYISPVVNDKSYFNKGDTLTQLSISLNVNHSTIKNIERKFTEVKYPTDNSL
jgi:hypothetical protein